MEYLHVLCNRVGVANVYCCLDCCEPREDMVLTLPAGEITRSLGREGHGCVVEPDQGAVAVLADKPRVLSDVITSNNTEGTEHHASPGAAHWHTSTT